MRDESMVDRRIISQIALDLLDLCRNLHELDFPWVTMSNAHDTLNKIKRLSRLKKLVLANGVSSQDHWIVNLDMDIRAQFGSTAWTMDQMCDLASSLPDLRSLEIGARLRSSRAGESSMPCALETFTFSLMRHAVVSWSYLERFLRGTIAAQSLRVLTIAEHQLEEGGLEQVLEAVGSSLEELHTLTKNPVAPTSVPRLAAIYCPNLRALTVGSRLHSLSLAFYSLARLRRLSRLTLTEVPYLSMRPSSNNKSAGLLVPSESFPLPLENVDARSAPMSRRDTNDMWTVERVLESTDLLPELRELTLGPSSVKHPDRQVWSASEIVDFEKILQGAGVRARVLDRPA